MDMAELEDNLKLSPWERMVKHDQILNDFLQREEFFNFMQRGREFVNRVEANRNLQSKI
jgi:hypothetical protein